MAQTLGDRIKTARKATGLTQKELADKINVGNTTISNWEKGVSRPDADQIQVLCWALDVQPNFFLGKKQTLADDDLAEYLTDLRDRPETRALLEASRGMSKEQVEAMSAFAKQLRGSDN